MYNSYLQYNYTIYFYQNPKESQLISQDGKKTTKLQRVFSNAFMGITDYTLLLNKHLSKIPDIDKIIVYGAGYRAPIAKFEVKTLEEKGDEYRYWNVFCLNGSKGVDSLKAVHELAEEAPSYTFCDNFY